MSQLCPLLKKPCIEHGCKFYTHVTGMHPQTGANVDHWDCAITWLPVMITEQARVTRGVAASVDSMRNEVVQRQDALNAAVSLGVNRETRPLHWHPTFDIEPPELRDDRPAIGVSEDAPVNGKD